MAVYMPPIDRKKRVPEKYNPDSFRVISVEAVDTHPSYPQAVIKPVFEKDTLPSRRILPDIPVRQTRSVIKPIPDFRAHRPHPQTIKFICDDVRLLNEPMGVVNTYSVQDEERNWYPHRTSDEPHHIPERKTDTTYRTDFLFNSENMPPGIGRHFSNPNKEPALGGDSESNFYSRQVCVDSLPCAPVNFLKERDGKQRFFQEEVSFQHGYNSRTDPNYPFGLRRQGAFVYKKLSPEERDKIIDEYTASEGTKTKYLEGLTESAIQQN